jgi:hypothetical protein
VCTIQEQVIPITFIIDLMGQCMHLYVCYLHWVMHTYRSFADLHLVVANQRHQASSLLVCFNFY